MICFFESLNFFHSFDGFSDYFISLVFSEMPFQSNCTSAIIFRSVFLSAVIVKYVITLLPAK